MGKRKQQMEEEIDAGVSGVPTHFDHLQAPPKKRNSKTMEFDSLETFEQYVQDQSDENQFDCLEVKLHYLPPFIEHMTHGNDDKIQTGMNALNKKYRRHLHQHVARHLLPHLRQVAGIDYDFKEVNKGFESNMYGTENSYKWSFMDDSNHGFDEAEYANRNHWKVQIDVETNSNGPYVDVLLKATPM